MANPWFRMYHEFATDPKMQMMSEAYQRRWLMLLCGRCSNDGETFHDDEIAFQLRVSLDDWMETKAVFIAKNLIDSDNNILAWDERQYVSDSSTARVKKHREQKKQQCNVSVTPPDTDTDTEQKHKKNSRFAPPSVSEVADYCKERNNHIDPNHFVDHYSANGWKRGNTPIKDWKACVRTWEKNNRGNSNGKPNSIDFDAIGRELDEEASCRLISADDYDLHRLETSRRG